MYLGKHHEDELGELGYRDYRNKRVNVFGVWEDGVQAASRKDGEIEVGMIIIDPLGTIIHGKNSSEHCNALTVKAGHEEILMGEDLFKITNNGQVYARKSLGVDIENPSSTFEVNGSLGAKVIKTSESMVLGQALSYIFTGNTTIHWSLPSIEKTANRYYYLKNRGEAKLFIIPDSSDMIYANKETNRISLKPGESAFMHNCGEFWNMF